MAHASNSRTYDFDFGRSYAVVWGEAQVSSEHQDSYEIQDQHIADQLSQKLPPLYADTIDLAVAVHCADRLAVRGNKKRGWGRTLRLKVAVRFVSFWQSAPVRDSLFETLQFLAQDHWEISFEQKAMEYRASETQEHLFDPNNTHLTEVSLYSGGLDSFAGLARRISEMPNHHFLCISVTPNQRQRQRQREQLSFLRKEFGAKITHLPVRYCIRDAERHQQEFTRRTRGFLFALIGGVAALMAGGDTLRLYENGIGAINLPLDRSQIGIDNSRSVHPISLDMLSQLLSLVGGHGFVIKNECAYLTKAEMCSHPAVKRSSLEIANTFSCDGFPVRRRKFAQCGFCTSCLLRRQALEAAALAGVDGDDYGCDLRTEGPFQPHHLRPLRAMHYQSVRLLDALIAPNAWAALTLEFPELRRIEEFLEDSQIRGQLLRLYGQHVKEWSSFSALRHLRQQSSTLVSTCVV
jgi:7-cyano-7-deazaguanine synthase in queuosine biosynthesis